VMNLICQNTSTATMVSPKSFVTLIGILNAETVSSTDVSPYRQQSPHRGRRTGSQGLDLRSELGRLCVKKNYKVATLMDGLASPTQILCVKTIAMVASYFCNGKNKRVRL